MKSKLVKVLVACMVTAGVIGGGFYGYKTVFAAKKTVATAAQTITVAARKMNFSVNVQGTGAAYSASTKDVMPSNNGTLKDLSVKVGDTVTAGQKLFASDSDDVRQAVTAAQNSLNDANISLSAAQAQLVSDQNDLAAAEAAQASGETQTGLSQGSGGQGSSSQGTRSVDQLKLQVEKSKSSVEQNKLKVASAKDKLTAAQTQVTKMNVTAPIGGVVTAVNFSNGDSAQQGKAVLTIVDMSAIKIKVAVDELDIEKIKLGQKAQIKFDAIKGKTYEGSVETIAQDGKSTNNVTTYDVVVAITDPTGIKLGMNANVNILVDSKENALVIPVEALVERNGQTFVRVEGTDSSAAGSNAQGNQQGQGWSGQGNSDNQGTTNRQSSGNNQTNRNSQGGNQANRNNQRSNSNATSSAQYVNVGRMVQIKTGLENENYVEVLEGLTEGQKVLIALPQTSTTTNNQNRNAMGGFGGGSFGGGAAANAFRRN